MAHKFLRITQPLDIHHAVFCQRYCIVEGGAERQPGFPQSFDIAHKAEGACARQLVAEHAWADLQTHPLAADQRCWKIDLNIEGEARMGNQLTPTIAILNSNRLQNLDVFAWRR